MTDLEKKVLDIIKKNDDGRGLPAGAYYTYYEYTHMKPDGTMDTPDLTKEEFISVVNDLEANGQLMKYENWNGSVLYTVAQEETASDDYVEVSNFLATLLDAFSNASEEQLIYTAKSEIAEFLQKSGMQNKQLMLKAMIISAKVGMSIDSTTLSDKQKEMLNIIFNITDEEKAESIYSMLYKKLPEEDLEFIKLAGGTPIGIHLLKYILAFSYIDGKPDNDTVQLLDGHFGTALLADFFEKGSDEFNPAVTFHCSYSEDQDEKFEEEKHNKEEEQKNKIAEKQKYESDMTAWRSKCNDIKSQIDNQVEELVLAEKTKIENNAKSQLDVCIAYNQKEIEAQIARKEMAEKQLETLGIFKLGEKKAQMAIIEEANKIINEANNTITNAEAEYKKQIEKASQNAKNKKIEFRSSIEKKMPLPKAPKMPASVLKDKMKNNFIYAEAIIEHLSDGKRYSIDDMVEEIPEIVADGISSQKVSAIVKQLKDYEIIKREEDGRKAYFSLN